MLAHAFNEVCSLIKEIIDDLKSMPAQRLQRPFCVAGASKAGHWEADTWCSLDCHEDCRRDVGETKK
jgi:hypothetical protein